MALVLALNSNQLNMLLKAAIVLLAAALQVDVSCGAGSTRLGQKDEVQHPIIEIDDGQLEARNLRNDIDDWNRGTHAVSSEGRSGAVEIHVPEDARAGDTLFMFLR